eukprot:evm.model.scf_488EXC.6 EVM.evm.TU.scf_488EXC.6   scf_488EXC:41654-44638(-)
MVECAPGGDPDSFQGFDIELVRYMATRFGWDPANYTFECFSALEDILDDLEKDGGSRCDIAASGITRSADREARGIQFTYPTFRSGLGIMVRASVKQGSLWAFLNPLHWSVWLATLATALAVALLVFVIESLAVHGFVHRKDWAGGLRNAVWDSMIALVNFGHFEVESTAARFVALGYGFLVLIVINTYVANLAAFLTVTQVGTNVSKVEDLYGERVATVDIYEDQLRRQGINPIVLDQDGDDVLETLVARLRNSQYNAVVMDEPWVTHTVGKASSCDLQKLPDTIVPFDYAFALPKSTPREAVDILSVEVLRLQEELISEDLVEKFISLPRTGCPQDNEISDTRPVKFGQVNIHDF